MIKVCKFGGSSLANATQYKKIKSSKDMLVLCQIVLVDNKFDK